LKSIVFPGNISVALIQGNSILRDKSTDNISNNIINNENDVYICLEQSLESISSILPNAYTIMPIPSLIYIAGSKYHRRVQIQEFGDSIYNFIPITILLSKILSVIHEVDIPKKLRLSHIVNTSLLYAIEHYPMLSQENKFRNNSEEDGISFNNKLQELGMSMEEFEQLQQPKYLKCYETMRGVIPTNIFETTLKTLKSDGVDPDVAGRIWHKRILWLACMHADDIKRIHIADLRGKYSFHGLDIFEMRAIWYIIPSWEGTNPKSEWKESFKARLHELSAKEITGTLSDIEERHPAYSKCERFDVYDSKVPLKRLHVDSTSSTVNTTSKPTTISPSSTNHNSVNSISSMNSINENDYISIINDDELQETESDERLLTTKLSEARKKKSNPISKRLIVATNKNRLNVANKEYGDFLNDTINEDEHENNNTNIKTNEIEEDHSREVIDRDGNIINNPIDDYDDDDSAFDEFEKNCENQDKGEEEDYNDNEDDDDEEKDYDDEYDEEYDDDDYDDDDDDDEDVVFGEGIYDDDSEYSTSSDDYEDSSMYKRVPTTAAPTTAFGCIPTSTFVTNNASYNSYNSNNDESSDIGENSSVIGSIISSVAVKSTVGSTTSNFVYAFKSLIGGGFAEEHRIQENDSNSENSGNESERYSPETVTSNDELSRLSSMPWNEFWKKISVARGYLSSVEEEKKIESEIDNYIVPEELVSSREHQDDMSVVDSVFNYQYADVEEAESFDEFEQFAKDNFWSISDDEHEKMKDNSSEGSYHTYVSQSNDVDYMSDVDSEGHERIKMNENDADNEKVYDNDDNDYDDDDDDDFYINSGLKINQSYENLETKFNGHRSPDTDIEAIIGEVPKDSGHASELLLKCASNPEDVVAPIDTLVKLINIYHADVNAVDESGSTPLHFLFNKSHLGNFLVSRGANILAKDKFGDSPLSLCIEYGYDWLLPAFEATDGASKFDKNELKEFAILLIHGGYGSRVRDLIDCGYVTITVEEALELMNRFHGNYEGMKEPVETYELLESLALQ